MKLEKLLEVLKEVITSLLTTTKCFLREYTIGNQKNNKIYKADIIDILKAILTSVIVIFLIAYLFYENIKAVVFLIPVGIFLYKKKINSAIESKKNQLKIHFKDAMTAVSFSLNVGYSMENSFKEAIQELRTLYGDNSMIVKEFNIIVNRVNRNEKLEDTLIDFARRSGIEDILYFAEVFCYAKVSGGDMISIIKNTVRTISEKIDTENEIQIVISSKKMEQKIMSIVPFGIITYLKLTSSDFICNLYGNMLGITVMSICLFMYFVSVLLANKIVDIKV